MSKNNRQPDGLLMRYPWLLVALGLIGVILVAFAIPPIAYYFDRWCQMWGGR